VPESEKGEKITTSEVIVSPVFKPVMQSTKVILI